jgi:DNA-directed RNA polymerase specialized sigma24 family protein
MDPDVNASPVPEVLDFEARRRQHERRLACEETRRQLRRILSGDREAAGWLYDKFSPGLFRRLRRRYGHLEGIEPDDLLHDAFLFFFQREAKVLRDFLERVRPQEQTPARLERYLWDLACGVASNRRRSAALRGHQSLDSVPPRERAGADDAEERQLLDRDEAARIDECLAKRGARLYLYYKLRYWDGYTPTEISTIMGWSPKATYKLRQALNEAVRDCAEFLGIPWRGSG